MHSSPLPSLHSALAASILVLFACGEIEPELLVDDDGEPLDLPNPDDEWLHFTDVQPQEEVSIRPTMAIEFNAYLDPASFNSYSTVRFLSGGMSHGGRVDYRMTRKKLLFRPNSNLEPDLEYRLEWTASNIRSVTDSPLNPISLLPVYRSREELETTPPLDRPGVGWDDVEEIFEAQCNQCHSDPDWMLPELTRDGLVGRRSEQSEAMLVEPFHPARSYLMHKILPDYPVRRFTVQPPPWNDQSPLSTDDIELIEHWIAGGAPR